MGGGTAMAGEGRRDKEGERGEKRGGERERGGAG